MTFFLLFACAEEPQSVCPSWSGLGLESRTWTYAPLSEGDPWDDVATLLALDHFELTRPGYDAELRCEADGLFLLNEHRVTDTLEAWWDYEPPALWMPALLESGTAWSLDAGYDYHDDAGVVVTRRADTQFAVVGEADQDVTAGGFSTLAIQVFDGAASDTRYYADGVGLVLDGTVQLVDVD